MPYIARRTKNSCKHIRIKDVPACDQNKVFYCPNFNCSCEYGVAAYNSNKMATHYFKIKSSAHVKGCPYTIVLKEETNINTDDVEFESFDKENFFKNLDSTYNEGITPLPSMCDGNCIQNIIRDQPVRSCSEKSTKVSTLRKLYALCRNLPADSMFNSKYKVIDLFAGINTKNFYTRFIRGLLLVECRYKCYSKENLSITFSYPYDEERFNITVVVEDIDLWKMIKNDVYGNTAPVLIYGYWENNRCLVGLRKQVVPLKN